MFRHKLKSVKSRFARYLDGAVSEVATRGCEFGLIPALNRKVELLTATVANSF